MKMSHLQVCLEGSKWEADGGAMFNCLSMAKKTKVRHTRKAGSRDPRMEVMEQRRWGSRGRIGRHRRDGIHMKMIAARSKHDTWKEYRAAGVRPICLWMILTLDTKL